MIDQPCFHIHPKSDYEHSRFRSAVRAAYDRGARVSYAVAGNGKRTVTVTTFDDTPKVQLMVMFQYSVLAALNFIYIDEAI